MPTIPIDFSGVESFDSLPIGEYEGSIDKVELRPATQPTKFDQIQVSYIVTDGEFTGRKQSEFLSMSPKAAFRLKKFFDRFGDLVANLAELDFDDDSNLLLEPDLVALDVRFKVYQDPKEYQGEHQIRTELIEVYDDAPAPAPTPVKTPRRAPVAVAAPVAVEEDEAEEDEAEPEVAPAPAARRRAAPAATAAPARRQLK